MCRWYWYKIYMIITPLNMWSVSTRVVQQEIISDLHNSKYQLTYFCRWWKNWYFSHQKCWFLYTKFCPLNGVNYKTVFAGILKFEHMWQQINFLLCWGKENSVAALLHKDVPQLLQQHCVADGEDFGIGNTCKNISIMQDVETLLRTMYTLFS